MLQHHPSTDCFSAIDEATAAAAVRRIKEVEENETEATYHTLSVNFEVISVTQWI